jgi:hypothetical protein
VSGERRLAAGERRRLLRQEEKPAVRSPEKQSRQLFEVLLVRRLRYTRKSDCAAGLGGRSSDAQGEGLNLPLQRNGRPLD